MIKDFPEKIKSLRKKYGYSQKDVAKKLGVSPSIVSGYETGERTPSTDILLSLSYLYNCSTDFLLGKRTVSNENLINVEGLNKKQIKAINDLIESIKESK